MVSKFAILEGCIGKPCYQSLNTSEIPGDGRLCPISVRGLGRQLYGGGRRAD